MKHNFSVIREVLQDARDSETPEGNERATLTGRTTPTQASAALDAIEARVAELEAALRDALGSFKCTQRVLSYPESHWSRRACALLNEEPEQPGYITFVRP